ncbi:hypothetical protein AGLY_011584, partial [Aphis glycines]
MFDTELFIIEVNKEESIWNMKSKLYHDCVEKHVSWRRVEKAMFNDFENLTEKRKRCKRKCVTKSGMAAKNAKCYTYAKVLEFLRPTMENKKTESNISSESSNEELSDLDSEREDDILMIGSNESEVDVQSPSTSKIPKEETDPDKMFLLSLLPQIKQLSQDKKTQLFIYFLNGIQQISHISNNPQTDFHSSHSQGYSLSPSQTPLNVLTDSSPMPQHYMQNNQNIQFSQSTHSSVNLPQNQPSTQTHHNNLPSYHEH